MDTIKTKTNQSISNIIRKKAELLFWKEDDGDFEIMEIALKKVMDKLDNKIFTLATFIDHKRNFHAQNSNYIYTIKRLVNIKPHYRPYLYDILGHCIDSQLSIPCRMYGELLKMDTSFESLYAELLIEEEKSSKLNLDTFFQELLLCKT